MSQYNSYSTVTSSSFTSFHLKPIIFKNDINYSIMSAEWKPLQSCSGASLPLLRLATEAVDYSYEIMSRSALTAYRRADSDIKSICHWDSQASQTC